MQHPTTLELGILVGKTPQTQGHGKKSAVIIMVTEAFSRRIRPPYLFLPGTDSHGTRADMVLCNGSMYHVKYIVFSYFNVAIPVVIKFHIQECLSCIAEYTWYVSQGICKCLPICS